MKATELKSTLKGLVLALVAGVLTLSSVASCASPAAKEDTALNKPAEAVQVAKADVKEEPKAEPTAVPAKKKVETKAKAEKAPAKKAASSVLTLAADKPVVTLKGDSTLHKFEATAEEASVTGKMKKAGGLLAMAKNGELESLKVVVQVKTLKSGKGGLDKNMYKAMEVKKFETIEFELKSYEVKGDKVTAKGPLTIHGVSNDVALEGELSGGADELTVKGSYDMIMSDYGIKPPVMMLGTIKVKDEITVDFDFTLQRSE